MDISSLGLIIIALAWLVQLFFILKNKKEIQKLFIILYMLGVSILVIGIYLSSKTISYYEIFTIIAAGIVLLKLFEKRKK